MKITRENITEHLLDYQLEMVGKDRTVLIDDDKWRFNVTITRIQLNEFREYSISLLQKIFKINKKKAKDNFEWFWMRFGLRIKN